MEQYVYYIIAGVIVLIGVITFFVMMFNTNYRKGFTPTAKPIEEYKEVRNKITLSHVEEEVEEEQQEEYYDGGFSLGKLMFALIGMVMVMAVGIPLTNQVTTVICEQSTYSIIEQNQQPVTVELHPLLNVCDGPVKTMLSWFPVFMAITMLFVVGRYSIF